MGREINLSQSVYFVLHHPPNTHTLVGKNGKTRTNSSTQLCERTKRKPQPNPRKKENKTHTSNIHQHDTYRKNRISLRRCSHCGVERIRTAGYSTNFSSEHHRTVHVRWWGRRWRKGQAYTQRQIRAIRRGFTLEKRMRQTRCQAEI